MDTINKLLKKQAPKRRGKISAAETAGEATPLNVQETAASNTPPEPTMTRWVSTRDSCKIGVPSEWLGTPAGRVFGDENRSPIPHAGAGGKLVEEV